MISARIRHAQLSLVLAVCGGLAATPARALASTRMPDTSKMNVLFIIAEDWNANTPGCYGRSPEVRLEGSVA